MRLVLFMAILVALASVSAAQSNETNGTNDTLPPEGGDVDPTERPATNESPEPVGPVEFNLEGFQEGSSFFWRLAGETTNNPTLTVAPGASVTFHFTSVTGVHNLKVGDAKTSGVANEGESLDYEWTAPTEPASVTYICLIHGAAMSGKVQVGAPAPGGGDGGAGGIQGESVDLGTVGYPECAGYMVPAVVTRNVVGGPTLADYAKQCKSGGASGPEARPAHGADYVIPISFALIGLGVVAIVWVHRRYKP